MTEQNQGLIVVVGYTVPMQRGLDALRADDSVIFVDEPDVAIGRGVDAHLAESTATRELINFEYQLPAAADAFVHDHPGLRPSAVIPGVEYAVPFAARLAERYGLPGAGLGAAQILRNKGLLRRVATAAGIANPRSRRVDGPGAVLAFMSEQPGPVVLKPANRQASVGTKIVHNATEIDRAWAECIVQDEGLLVPGRGLPLSMLVERYVQGDEFSVEMIVRNGTRVFGNVTAKTVFPGPRPVELGHAVPADLAPAQTASLLAETERVLGAVGFGSGFVHCEWIVSGGTPYLVECAGRMPGDGIMELIEKAWQFEVVPLYLSVMEGLPITVQVPQEASKGAAVWFLHVEPGEVREVDGIEDAKAVPDVVTVMVGPKPGDQVKELRSSWDRVALATAASANTADALRRAQQAIAAIRITVARRNGSADDLAFADISTPAMSQR
jgi:biotin carboxylase